MLIVPPPGDIKSVPGIVASAKAPYVLSPVVVISTLVALVTPFVSEYRPAAAVAHYRDAATRHRRDGAHAGGVQPNRIRC